MKKYVSCFLFFFSLTAVCLVTLFVMTVNKEPEEAKEVQVLESVEKPVFAESGGQEREPEVHVVLNQESVAPSVTDGIYCLVAEEGYLIVYDKDEETVRLFTHMPLAEFPVREQEKLMEGIWFSTMAEIFSYLESYSS